MLICQHILTKTVIKSKKKEIQAPENIFLLEWFPLNRQNIICGLLFLEVFRIQIILDLYIMALCFSVKKFVISAY